MWHSRISAIFKFVASFFKRDLLLDDYPIIIKDMGENLPDIGNLKPVRWFACIYNWEQRFGAGDTKEEALARLQQSFYEYREAHERLPRPGVSSTLVLSLIDEEKMRVSRSPDYMSMANEFFRRMDYDINVTFITPLSSLWDFFFDSDELAQVYEQIRQEYGVDVSDISDGNLFQILDRLNEKAQ